MSSRKKQTHKMQAGDAYQFWRWSAACWWQSDSLQFKVVPCWASRYQEIKAELPLPINMASSKERVKMTQETAGISHASW